MPARRFNYLAVWRNTDFLIPAIRPPSVPDGTARLRISVTAGHSEADVMQLIMALRDCVPSRT